MIHPRPPQGVREDKWDTCCRCDKKVTKAEIRFYQGTVAPTVGETITGASSADTGVVESVLLESGSYAGSDAVGTMILTSPTGFDDNGKWGTVDESLNGSTSGNGAWVLTDEGIRKIFGRLWPSGMLIDRNGHRYCPEHYKWAFVKDDLDNVKIDIDEKDRGKR